MRGTMDFVQMVLPCQGGYRHTPPRERILSDFFHAYLHPTKKYNNYWLDDASEVTGILDTYGKLFSEARKRPRFSANVEFEGFVSDNSPSKQHATADGELWQRVLLCMVVLLVGLRAIVRRCFKDCF